MARRAGAVAAAAIAVVATAVAATPAHSATTRVHNHFTMYRTHADGGEPSISWDTKRRVAMYGAETANRRLMWRHGHYTTVDVTAPTSKRTFDAITVVDRRTGRSFVSQLALACSLFSYSDNAGKSWTPGQGCGVGTAIDHQSVGAGRFHKHAATQALTNYPDAVYYCAQDSFNGLCAVSQDGGRTFGDGVAAYNSPANDPNDPNQQIRTEGGACSALHGHVRVGPNGTAYLPIKGCGGKPTTGNLTNTEYWGGHPSVSISRDNGSTWIIHRVDAGHNSDESDPSIAIGRGNAVPGGRVYLGWEDGTNPSETGYGKHSSARIAMSTNGGRTWSKPVDVSSRLGIRNVQFPEVIAGDDSRAAFAWLGTKAAGDDQHNGFKNAHGKPAVWRLYVSITYNGGRTWHTTDTTPHDPVQRGCVDLQGTSNKTATDKNICSQRNLLDFNDITVDNMGRVIVAYADGCVNKCVTSRNIRSKADVGSVMRLTRGRGLFRRYDGKIR